MKKTILKLLVVMMMIVGINCTDDFPCAQGTVTAEAAVSKNTKKKAQKAYREWLDESDFVYFRLYDLNKDGLKELLVSYDTYGAKGTVFCAYVYTYKKGKVVYCGTIRSNFGLSYNTKTKRIQGSRGGGGSIENWYYKMSSSGKISAVYLQAIESGVKNGKMTYKYYYANKRISKSTYQSKLKTWRKNTKSLKFYRLSVSNILKYTNM